MWQALWIDTQQSHKMMRMTETEDYPVGGLGLILEAPQGKVVLLPWWNLSESARTRSRPPMPKVPRCSNKMTLSLFKTPNFNMGIIKGGRGRVPRKGKGEGPLEKVQVLRICRGVGVFPSRVRRD